MGQVRNYHLYFGLKDNLILRKISLKFFFVIPCFIYLYFYFSLFIFVFFSLMIQICNLLNISKVTTFIKYEKIFYTFQYQRILEYNGEEKLPASWWGTIASTPSANRSVLFLFNHYLKFESYVFFVFFYSCH